MIRLTIGAPSGAALITLSEVRDDMPKLSPRADRILFFGVCGLIGIFSIGFWFSVAAGFRKSPMINTQATVEIPVNETIRAVWDSGLSTEGGLSSIYWLDNDTIIFGANNGPKPRTPEEIHARETWLYLWRLGDKPRPYGADPHTLAGGCAARGEVTYYEKTIDPQTGAVSRTRWVEVPGGERRTTNATSGLEQGRRYCGKSIVHRTNRL
jgi:hypothetical protein